VRTLILGDIHDKIDIAQAILDGETWDRACLLGDYFDDFNTGVKEARRTAQWLKGLLQDERIRALLGNHDMPYLWPYVVAVRGPGFDKLKSAAISEELAPLGLTRKKLCLYDWVDGWLLSHAGITRELAPPSYITGEEFKVWLQRESERCLSDVFMGTVRPLLARGRDRGGVAGTGGLIWCDWNNFHAIPHVNQLMGHTGADDIRVKKGVCDRSVSNNYCIDTFLKFYAIIEDGEVTFHQTHTLLADVARRAVGAAG
jgi:hypothetical protein